MDNTTLQHHNTTLLHNNSSSLLHTNTSSDLDTNTSWESLATYCLEGVLTPLVSSAGIVGQ